MSKYKYPEPDIDIIGNVPKWKLELCKVALNGLRELAVLDMQSDTENTMKILGVIDTVLEDVEKDICCDCCKIECECEEDKYP